MKNHRPLKLVVIGAGSRGSTYANYALEHPEELEIVGVAEPRDFHRQQMARMHKILPEYVTRDWHDWLTREKFADAIIVATPDVLHAGPAIAFAELGYHLLLEKPMAPSEAECRKIVDAVNRTGVMLAVCHVMRYTP